MADNPNTNETNIAESLSDYLYRLYGKAKQQNFRPEDSQIVSSIMHPNEAVKRYITNNIVNASGNLTDEQLIDNPNPLFGLSPEQQALSGLNLATMAGTGSMPFNQSGPATLGTFAGLGSKTANKLNAGLARDMEAAGKSPEEILNTTGWFRGAEGRQRYEINDANAKMKLPMGDILESPLFGKPKGNYTLQDILDHPELYKAYPELANTPFIKRPGFLDLGSLQGWRGENEIGLTPYAKDPLGTLLHEAQHYIQEKEGYGLGGNADSVLSVIPEEAKLNAAKEAVGKVSSKLADIGEIVKSTEEYANDPNVIKLQNIANTRDQLWRKYYDTGDKEAYTAHTDMRKEIESVRKEVIKNIFDKNGRYELSDIEKNVLDALESPKIHAKNIDKFTSLQQDLSGIQSGDLKALAKHTDTHELYKRLAGETEARNVPDRRLMTNEQRKEKPAWETQEYPYNKQFINTGK